MGYALLDNDRSYTPAGSTFADIQAEFNRIPPLINANVTVNLPGTRAAPVTISFSETAGLAIGNRVFDSKTLTVQADDSAYSGVLTPAGGGADFLTIAKASVPAWAAGNWAGAKLLILSTTNDAAFATSAGDIRDVVPGGIAESDAAGNPGVTHWKISVTAAFTSTFGAGVIGNCRFCIHACVIQNTLAGVLQALSTKTSGPGTLLLKNIGFFGYVFCRGGGNVQLLDCSVFGYATASVALNIQNHTVLLPSRVHLVGNAAYGITSANLARYHLVDSYLTDNAIGAIVGFNQAGNVGILERCILDRNTTAAACVTSLMYVRNCTLVGSDAGHRTFSCSVNGIMYTNNNTGVGGAITETAATGGVFV